VTIGAARPDWVIIEGEILEERYYRALAQDGDILRYYFIDMWYNYVMWEKKISALGGSIKVFDYGRAYYFDAIYIGGHVQSASRTNALLLVLLKDGGFDYIYQYESNSMLLTDLKSFNRVHAYPRTDTLTHLATCSSEIDTNNADSYTN